MSERDGLAPPRSRAVSAEPYQLALPARPRGPGETTWDFHRSVLSAILSRRPRQTPWRTIAGHRASCVEKAATASRASANDGAWHPARAESRRLLDYLRLAPSSAQVAPHRWLHTP